MSYDTQMIFVVMVIIVVWFQLKSRLAVQVLQVDAKFTDCIEIDKSKSCLRNVVSFKTSPLASGARSCRFLTNQA